MSQSDDSVVSKQCYKCEQQLFDNLNIEFNSNSTIALWNKYQILIYENFKFDSETKILSLRYQIQSLLITNNCIVCVDSIGAVNVFSLKFKNDQKLIQCTYEPRESDIQACVKYSHDESLSLKYKSGIYFLIINKITLDFTEVKKVELSSKDPLPYMDKSSNKHLLAHRKMDGYHGMFKKFFNNDKLNNTWHFVVISFDKLTLYACLFDPNTTEKQINLIKLYSCPSEICGFEMFGSDSNYYICIGLKMGTVIRLTLNDTQTGNNATTEPEVAHLNSALHKLLVINESDTFVYTDGTTMWHAEKVFTKNIIFKQFFIRNVKDFILCGDRIICTTFTKLIYTFHLQDEKSYIKQADKEYNSTETLLNNSDYLNKIFEEVEKSKELSKQFSIEGSYISAVSLSRRPKIMHKIISSSATVCCSFEEIMKENREEITLTEDISQYVQPYIYLLMITFQINSDGPKLLLDLLSQIMANCETELRVTLSNKHEIIKTTSAKVNKTNLLMPLNLEHSSEIDVDILIVVQTPGTYDKKQKIWTELYKQSIKLTSDHFIRANFQKPLIHFKRKEEIENTIKLISNQFPDKYEFKDITKNLTSHVMYVRLPQKFNFCDIAKHFANTKSQFMVEILSSDEFLKSQNEVGFMVGQEAVTLVLENDGFSNPRLKVTSANLQITANIRNFFADIVYGENTCKSGEEYINSSFYTTVENLQKAVKNSITTSASYEQFAPLAEQFEKDIISMLPV